MEFDFDKFDNSKNAKPPVDDLEPPKDYKKSASENDLTENTDIYKNDIDETLSEKSLFKSKDNKKNNDKETVTVSFTVKKLTKKQIIAIIVVAVLLIVFVPTGIYCGVNNESPTAMLHDIFTDDETLIIGKWQDADSKSGYQFNEDGTVISYNGILGDKNGFSYNYTIKGKRITFTNRSYNYTAEYKYSVNGDTLKMTRVKYNDNDITDEEEFVYSRVDYFNISSLMDTLADAANVNQTAKLINDGKDIVAGEKDVYINQYNNAVEQNDSAAIEVLEDDGRIVYISDGTEVTVLDSGDEYSSIKIEKGKYKDEKYYVSNNNIQYDE